MSDVVITGIGLVCSLGQSRTEVLTGLKTGRRPFGPVRRFDASTFKVNLAAEAPELDVAGRFGARVPKHTSRTDQLAMWAAADALAHADLKPEELLTAGLFVGASSGGMLALEARHPDAAGAGLYDFWSYPIWATARCLAQRFQIRGPRATYMTACSSSAHALGIAMQRVRSGELPLAIAGGAESVCRLTLAGFGSLGVLDPNGTRPFDVTRQGITLGEGAAFFVLERRDRALARNVEPLAVLAGYGATAEAHHMVHPRDDGSGALMTMQRALADAHLDASAIDYINAHGTGTLPNDAMEARAIVTLAAGRPMRVSSSKSMLGHTLGAAGALEAAVSVLAMHAGFTPGNAGVQQATAELAGVNLLTESTGPAPLGILSSSYAFGGNNAALALMPASYHGVHKAPARHAVFITGAAVAGPSGTAFTPDSIAALAQQTPTHGGLAGLDPGEILGRATIRRMDPLSAGVTALAKRALQSADLTNTQEELGLMFGTAFGALDQTVAFTERLANKGAHLVNPMEFPNLVHNAPAGQAGILLGARGPSVTACQEELAGDEAVRLAIEAVACGLGRRLLAGGGDLASHWLDRGYALVDRLLQNTSTHDSVLAMILLESDVGLQERGIDAWAKVLAKGSAGGWSGVCGAIGLLQEQLATTKTPQPTLDLWCRNSHNTLTSIHETRALTLPWLHQVATLQVRTCFGNALGAGPTALAVAAANIKRGTARHVLVTSVTSDGCAEAFLLGPAA